MKNIFLFILTVLLLGSCKTAADQPADDFSSGFDIETVSDRQVDNLVVLGKVWGYVKYHHPGLKDSETNMDAELFRLLPKVAGAGKDKRNRILLKWIESLGKFESDSSHFSWADDERARVTVNLDWTSDREELGLKLSDLLCRLRYAVRDDEANWNPYVGREDQCWNVTFTEREYPKESPDYGYRLLSLFRYWNIVEYFFPYKHLMDILWEDALPYFVRELAGARTDREYRLAIAELMTRTDDSHSGYLNMAFFGERIVPAMIGFVEGKYILTKRRSFDDFRLPRDLQPGAEIVAIDGELIIDRIETLRKYIPHSNEDGLYYIASYYLLTTDRDEVELTYISDGEERRAQVKTRSFDSEVPPSMDLEEVAPGIVYLHGLYYTAERLESILHKLGGSKAMILDLRCYPDKGDVIDEFLGNHLMNEQRIFSIGYVPSALLPGVFFSNEIPVGKTNPNAYKGGIVVIVDHRTMSHPEFATMAYQSRDNVVTVGSTTAGADGNALYFPLPGGLSARMTNTGISYPDSTECQRIGIRIDKEVRPTIQGIKEGRDELLEEAVRIAKTMTGNVR